MNEPMLHFDQLSKEAQDRILASNQSMEDTLVDHFPMTPGESAQISADRNRQRLKELEAELERRATSHPADRVDESLEKGTRFDRSTVETRREFLRQHTERQMDAQSRLTFELYQAGAKKTAIYNRDARVLYPALGLTGEVAEVIEKVLEMAKHAGLAANQVKKIIRDDNCECDTPRKHDIAKELGGVLWYLAAVASDLGLNLGDIAQENLDVLASRQERGTIKGDGDNR